jgi:predicted dehydrogenase
MSMRKVRWGVLSTAKIAREKVLPALQASQHCDVVAIASRSMASARATADVFGIGKAYGCYEDLIADPGVEVIYNPLPNDMHVAWTLAAARAGKHVLCEKPFSMNAKEAHALREVADKVHIMEAFMVRFHPQWLRAREIVRSGALGQVRAIQVFFSYHNTQAGNIRNRVDNGGGALYDIGGYAIVAGRFFFEAEPVRAIALIDRDPSFHTDRACSAVVDFGLGRQLDFTVSTQSAPYQRVHIVGSQQRLEIEVPFNAAQGAMTRLFLNDGKVLGDAQMHVETIPAADQYALQCDAFSRAVLGQIPLPYGYEDALCNMRTIDALYASAALGLWQTV